MAWDLLFLSHNYDKYSIDAKFMSKTWVKQTLKQLDYIYLSSD